MWNSLTPSAMRKCSPLFSVLSRTKFRKAVMFSGRVMSPSPSTPPSPETHRGQVFTQLFITRQRTSFSSPIQCDVHARTIIRLKQLARGCKEILQLEVTGSFKRHAKPLRMPTSPPQYVLWKASRSRTNIAKVQKLTLTVLCQRFLCNKRGLSHYLFMCVCWDNYRFSNSVTDSPLVNPLGW